MKLAGGFPPCDVVERMVRCYRAPHLAYEHLRETTGLLAYVIPELEQRGVLESAARVCLGLKRSAPTAERLLELALEGEIATARWEEFEQLMEGLQELVRPCLELEVYWRKETKGEKHGRITQDAPERELVP